MCATGVFPAGWPGIGLGVRLGVGPGIGLGVGLGRQPRRAGLGTECRPRRKPFWHLQRHTLVEIHQMLTITHAHRPGAHHAVITQTCAGQQGQQLFIEVAVPHRAWPPCTQSCQQRAFLGAQPPGQLALLQQKDLSHTGLALVERTHPAAGRQNVHGGAEALAQQPDHRLDQHQVAHGAEAHQERAGRGRSGGSRFCHGGAGWEWR